LDHHWLSYNFAFLPNKDRKNKNSDEIVHESKKAFTLATGLREACLVCRREGERRKERGDRGEIF
jgi:hypothetical protein